MYTIVLYKAYPNVLTIHIYTINNINSKDIYYIIHYFIVHRINLII